MYHLYILYSFLLDKYYVGFTGDSVELCLYKHNSNHKGFTGRVSDWKIVYCEVHETKEPAMKREKEIKAWKSRKKIEEVVKAFRP